MSFSGYIVATQSDGSQIIFERWVYEYWVRGILVDPILTDQLNSATKFTKT